MIHYLYFASRTLLLLVFLFTHNFLCCLLLFSPNPIPGLPQALVPSLVSASSSSLIYLVIHVSPLWAQLNRLDLGKSQICISSQTSLWSWAYNCLLNTSWFLSQTHPLCTAFDLRGLLFHLSNCSGGKFFFHTPEESPFILRLLTIFRFLSLLTIAFTTAWSKSPWQDLPWMQQSPLSCQDDPLTGSQTCLSAHWPLPQEKYS